MITLTFLICWVMLIRWQVRHLHFQNFLDYKYGERIIWRGYHATVIDVKATDMVIRRDLIGLVWKGAV